jgi:DNA-binding transcriptional ArsR family regulator
MKRWELVFKALANVNRLKIIKMLHSGKRMNVTEITEKLDISFMATSRHLVILRNFSVLMSEGKKNHVSYYIHPDIPKDFQKIFKVIL